MTGRWWPPAPLSKTVAIVHDYLNQVGGAERVVLELVQLWPEAEIFTSFYRKGSTYPEFAERDIHVSFLDRLPVDEGFRSLFPLYPAAFRTLGPLDQDIVVSSSSGWAHGVRCAPGSTHVVYCHTPARWLYGDDSYVPSRRRKLALRPLLKPLVAWDRRAARRADAYVANSQLVRRRIAATYGIDAPVIYPQLTSRGLGRSLAVSDCSCSRVSCRTSVSTSWSTWLRKSASGWTWSARARLASLRERAGPSVAFHGRLPDEDVTELLEGCRALCLHGLTVLGVRNFSLSRSSLVIKRAFDLAVGLLGLVLAAPLWAVVVATIRLGSDGPVMFRQERIGRNGQLFRILKFRTMVADAEGRKEELRERNEGAPGFFKIADDPRVTRVGRLLRNTSLDELPQLVNVLRGEMSLVGPRPLIAEEDRRVVGWQRRRLELTPGITGPWQVLGSSRVPLSEMVALDYLYVANWSLWSDVKLLLRTVPHVISGRGL